MGSLSFYLERGQKDLLCFAENSLGMEQGPQSPHKPFPPGLSWKPNPGPGLQLPTQKENKPPLSPGSQGQRTGLKIQEWTLEVRG